MFEWLKKNKVTIQIAVDKAVLIKLEEIMASLTDVQSQATALQASFAAEQTRQAAKNTTLQASIDAANASLATVQAELNTLKAGGQTPENQVIIDDIATKVGAVITGLDNAATTTATPAA